MHVRGCYRRTYSDLVPGVVPHVHDTFPVSRVQVGDGGIHLRGTVLVLTYGFGRGWEAEEACFQQFGRIVRRLWYGKMSVPVPKAPGQTSIDGF